MRCSKKGILTEGKKKEIIEQLNIETGDECETLREEIKKQVAERRTTRPIKEWIKEERPREMLIRMGARKFALVQAPGHNPEEQGNTARALKSAGQTLLNHFGSLRAIDAAPISELSKIEGIGPAKAAQIKASLELGKRLFQERALARKKLTRPDDVISYVSEYYAPYLRDKEKEFLM